ncbi:MAG: TatD family hydrolase [Candidatus Caccovivens sp.]
MELVDVHAHLCDEKFDNVDEVIAMAFASGVKKIICASYNLSSSKDAVELSKKYKSVFATVGVHPENVVEYSDFSFLNEIETLAQNEKVVAIGEIGLDYHYFDGLTQDEIEKIKKQQKFAFTNQIAIANKLNLPVQIHSRDAMGDTIEILKRNPLKRKSLLHCYSGSIESASILMDLGFSFSFGGVVTFSNAKNVQEVVKNLPIERILLETDCPYMSPVPFRGQRNEPKNVVYIADAIARLKGMKFEQVLEKTTENAQKMFKI